MKKLIYLLCLCLFLGVVTGCGKKSPLDPKNPTHVVIWNYYNGDQLTGFQNLVDEFNATVGVEKGIIVEQVSQGNIDDLANNLLDAVNGKVGADNIPSAAAVYPETSYILENQDAIVPIDDYFTKEELSQFVANFIDEGRLQENGQLYTLPISKSTEVFIVNATDWAKFEAVSGISIDDINTNEDLVKAAEQYYNYCHKALYGRDSVANYLYVGAAQLGHPLFTVDANGELKIDLDYNTLKTLWDNYYIPYIKGYFGQSNKFRSEDIKRGVIISMTGSSSGVSYIPTSIVEDDESTRDVDIVIKKALSFANGQDIYVSQGAGYTIMKTNEAEQYATAEFLKWFTDSDQNLNFSISSGYSPVKSSDNTEAKISEVYTVENAKQQNMLNALLVSADIFTNNVTYATKPFNGSKETREVLDTALSDICSKDRQTVVDRMKAGATLESATAEFVSEEYFKEWYNELVKNITAVTK